MSNKAERYAEPSRIKRLPDVGMVKVYPKCVLKLANVVWVGTMSQYTPPCSWTFSTIGFSIPVASESQSTSPTSLRAFVGNIFTPLVSLLFMECKLHDDMWTWACHTSLHQQYTACHHTCPNITPSIISHVPEWTMHPARLAVAWTWTCSSTRNACEKRGDNDQRGQCKP